MADIVEDCRGAARRFQGMGGVLIAPDYLPELLIKGAAEIDKLRKEVKSLKMSNAMLIQRNITLFCLVTAVACGAFMAAFLAHG